MIRPSMNYYALHAYLRSHYSKDGECDNCGRSVPTEYALIHGRAHSRDRGDYQELCHRCHVRYDQGGERNSRSRLTWEQVMEIRQRYQPAHGGRGLKPNSQRALAAEFGVSRSVIKNIVQGRKWVVG